MKFLIGIISGITLAGAGIAVTSGTPAAATAQSLTPQTQVAAQTQLTPQSALAVQTTTPRATTTKRLQAFTGELSRSDTGTLELKLKSLRNGEVVDRDVRVLIARATVTNRAGNRTRLPLENATARVTGVLLARAAWRLDEDGQPLATIAAEHILITTTKARENTERHDTPETHDSNPD